MAGPVTLNPSIQVYGSPLSPGVPSAGAPVSVLTQTRVVFIAQRPDGGPGSGHEFDPYDGTGTKLDSLLPTLPAFCRIIIGPGVYLTQTGLNLKDGQMVEGAGIDVTTIRLNTNAFVGGSPAYNIFVIAYIGNAVDGTFHSVRNLTVDCNVANQANANGTIQGSISAIYLQTLNGLIEDCKVIGQYANPGEGFPIAIFTQNIGTKSATNPAVAHIRRLIYIGNGLATTGFASSSLVSCFDQTPPDGTSYANQWMTGSITECTLSNQPGCVGFGAGGWNGFLIANNKTSNIGTFMVQDTHKGHNVTVFDNVAEDLMGNNSSFSQWFCLANGNNANQYKNYKFIRNTSRCKATATAGNLSHFQLASPDMTDLLIDSHVADANGVNSFLAYNLFNVWTLDGIIRNCRVSPVYVVNSALFGSVTNARLIDNTCFDGTPLRDGTAAPASTTLQNKSRWNGKTAIISGSPVITVLGQLPTAIAAHFDLEIAFDGTTYAGQGRKFHVYNSAVGTYNCVDLGGTSTIFVFYKNDGSGNTVICVGTNVNAVNNMTLYWRVEGTPFQTTVATATALTQMTLTGGGGGGLADPGANGIIKRTSLNVTAQAVAGTDYIAATTGSSIQKASAGGLVAAVASTDYIAATTGAAIQKASAGGLVAAVAGTDYLAATTGNLPLKGSAGSAVPIAIQAIGDVSATITNGTNVVRLTTSFTNLRTFTMPASASYTAGDVIEVRDGNAFVGNNTLSIVPAGTDTINGGTLAVTLMGQGGGFTARIRLDSSGTNWCTDSGLCLSNGPGGATYINWVSSSIQVYGTGAGVGFKGSGTTLLWFDPGAVFLTMGNATNFGWNVAANPNGSGNDTGFNRNAAGVVEINSGTAGVFRDLTLRQLLIAKTITAAGTTGAQTINKGGGSIRIAAAGTTVVLTNSLLTVSTLLMCSLSTSDATAKSATYVLAAGSVTFTLNAAATAETEIRWAIVG